VSVGHLCRPSRGLTQHFINSPPLPRLTSWATVCRPAGRRPGVTRPRTGERRYPTGRGLANSSAIRGLYGCQGAVKREAGLMELDTGRKHLLYF